MDRKKYPIDPDIKEEIKQPKDHEVQFYLNEMQQMNNQMIDMQRDLNRALRESKRMQTELEQNNGLKEALDVAEKANQAKMDFMSRMSHDLRTPMNVIMGLVATTLDEADNPEAVRENMTNIRSASDYMLGLINDILDIAKADKDRIELKYDPYCYNEFLLEMQTMFQAQCDAKNIEFICEDPSSYPVIMTDKQRLKQIIFNILSNAVKYTKPGGTIKVDPRVLPADSENKVAIEFRVSDTGIGMSKEFQKRLFEPFVQEDSSVSPELRGSGLGLSITKRLIDYMDGTIEVESEKGKGTTFIVRLTFELASNQDIESYSKVAPKEDYTALLLGKTVLLVEDHPLNAMIARNILEKKQITVLQAEDGKAGVELFQASPVGSLDAILMDIRMPVMTGLEAAKEIRALDRPDAATIPIIALSANTYPSDIKASLDAGMNAHLAKPIEADELYETLAKFL